jgi:alkanesulfonate monooxygenase SsuD/methylene tetrahydromethanopterin reductase-like flavin-dependent oxidoreductase (luciferase family)
VQFVANMNDALVDAASWAKRREDEGWDIIAACDHYFRGRAGASKWKPHLWVTVSQMAAATSKIRITSTFANNLFRSPVEFVQASWAMQRASGGRWEAGLGAGWTADELTITGQAFPQARERADRYIEAVQIIRQLFDTHQCEFAGEYYKFAVPKTEGYEGLLIPPLVGALGGKRTIAGAAPYLDRVELKASSSSTRAGSLDLAELADTKVTHLKELVDRVRDVRPDVAIGMYAPCGLTTDPVARELANRVDSDDALFRGFFGEPAQIADALFRIEDYGVTTLSITSTEPDTFFETLAPHLFS